MKGAMLVGSPDTIAAKLAECAAAGVPHMMLCFNYGHMSREQANRQLDLFLSDVYPKFANGGDGAKNRLALASAL